MSRKFNQASWEDELEDLDDNGEDYMDEDFDVVFQKKENHRTPSAEAGSPAQNIEPNLQAFMQSLVKPTKLVSAVSSSSLAIRSGDDPDLERLFASPSSFATILLSNCQTTDQFLEFDETGGFDFDGPSPDDVVLRAQSKSEGISGPERAVTEKMRSLKVEDKKPSRPTTGPIEKKPAPKVFEPKKPVQKKAAQSLITKNLVDIRSRNEGKPSLNLVVVGHVDAGKSTLMGHLLVKLGKVDEKTIRGYERDSKKIGKGSFAFAWVLDATETERSRGVTIDVAVNKFETAHKIITLMDAPGHKDFVPNMISGASRADAAVLVVDANFGEFETGFASGGQTKEHVLLLRSLGVSQVVVAVNKMDKVSWNIDRFNEIMEILQSYLVETGFEGDRVRFVPVSGFVGSNLVDRCSDCTWYTGLPLIELIDSFEVPERLINLPLRFTVHSVFKGSSANSVALQGKVQSGICEPGQSLKLMPLDRKIVLKSIEVHESAAKFAMAGDFATLTVTQVEVEDVQVGNCVCAAISPAKVAGNFTAEIVTFDIEVPLTLGYSFLLHINGVDEPACIKKLVRLVDRDSGEELKRSPRLIPKDSTAVVEIATDRKIVVEPFSEFREMGRFTMRHRGSTLGSGIVAKVAQQE